MRDEANLRSLVISDGGLTGLVALAISSTAAAADPADSSSSGSNPIMWLLPQFGTRRRAAAQAQGTSLRLEIVNLKASQAPFPDLPEILRLLFVAGRLADEHDCGRIVLPHCCGDDAAAIVEVDSAIATVRPLLTEAGIRREAEILTPLLDLTVDQVADLAVELDIPVELCWWSSRFESLCDEREPEAERWLWEGALARAARAEMR